MAANFDLAYLIEGHPRFRRFHNIQGHMSMLDLRTKIFETDCKKLVFQSDDLRILKVRIPISAPGKAPILTNSSTVA